MFTGLVQTIGTLLENRPGAQHATLVIGARLEARDRTIGASVAVDGVCLTVTEAREDRFLVDAAFETLQRTTLGKRMVNDQLNLEPALRVGDALGGHLVSGHVDGIARVRTVAARGDAKEIWVDLPPRLLGFCAPKGSICLDGTSLTINAVDPLGLSVGIVPHTLRSTTIGSWAPGRPVNVEIDLVARYVARLLQSGLAGAHASPDDMRAPSPAQTQAPGPGPSGGEPNAGVGVSIDDLVSAGYLDPGDGRR